MIRDGRLSIHCTFGPATMTTGAIGINLLGVTVDQKQT